MSEAKPEQQSDNTKDEKKEDKKKETKKTPRKTLHQVEYKLAGNILGLLIALGGFAGGYIARDMVMPSWQDNFVILIILFFITLAIVKNIMTITEANLIRLIENERANEAVKRREARKAFTPQNETVAAEPVVMGQLPHASSMRTMSEEQVLEAVAKRIEQKKKEADKTNKFVN